MQPAGRKTLGAAAFVVLAALFVGVNVVAGHLLRGARLDLTENRLYTLSDGTQRLVAGLDEPVNLEFHFSRSATERVPQVRPFANRVQELLEEIAAASNGKVRLRVVDPAPFSEDEDRAVEFGLTGVPLGVAGEQLFLGLAGTNSVDGRAAIPLFQPQREEFLEYEVARLIHQLAVAKRPVVGLLAGLPMTPAFDPAAGGMRPGWAIVEEIGDLYDVRSIAPDGGALPNDLDVLMVVHPKGLSTATKYAIDQFVLRGGRLLLFVDPESQQDPLAERAAFGVGADRASTLEPLLGAWGVGYDPTRAFGDLEHALMVGDPQGGNPTRHLGFAGFGADSFAPGDVVTAALEMLNVATPGFLAAQPPAGVVVEPLVTSSARAAPIAVERIAMASSPEALRQGFAPTGQRYVLAARVTGRLPSAFPAGPPEGAAAGGAHLAVAAEPANLIVVADTDLLADMLWMRSRTVLGQRLAEPWASNGDFVLNALDNLAGSADLIAIRGRATYSRPFTRVEALRERADERLRRTAVELERELAATEQKLLELESGRDDGASLALTPAQQAEIERFQAEKARLRRELREVRRALDEDIERLGTRLAVLNTVAVPALLSLLAVAVALLRRRRRARREGVA